MLVEMPHLAALLLGLDGVEQPGASEPPQDVHTETWPAVSVFTPGKHFPTQYVLYFYPDGYTIAREEKSNRVVGYSYDYSGVLFEPDDERFWAGSGTVGFFTVYADDNGRNTVKLLHKEKVARVISEVLKAIYEDQVSASQFGISLRLRPL